MKRLLGFCLAMFVLLPVAAEPIDLTNFHWYFREGYSSAWARVVPSMIDKDWVRVENPRGTRTMIIRDLDIPRVGKSSAWNPFPKPLASISVIIPFTVTKDFLETSDPALFLAQVGQSWAVYLNGYLVHSELNKGAFGLYIERTRPGTLLPIDARLLTEGINILTIHLIGDPGDANMGFPYKSPYLLDSYRMLANKNLEYIDILLISVYAIFGLYHIILFLLRPKDTASLLFGLATIDLSVYLASLSSYGIQLINNAGISKRLEFASLILLLPLFFAFFDLLLKARISRMTKTVSIAYLVLLIPGLILRSEPFLKVWQGLSFISMVYFLIFVLGFSIVRDIRNIYRGKNGRGIRDLVSSIRYFTVAYDSGKILFGTIIFIVAVAADILRATSGQETFLVKYTFIVFLLGAAAMQAGRVISVYSSLETLNVGLERTVNDRTAALSDAISEQKRLNARILESNRELHTKIEESVRDMKVAISVQKGFFPAVAPKVPGWDLALVFEPAAGLSGDLYDFYVKDDEFGGILVGNVSGKGIASGLITLLARSVFFRKLNDALFPTLPEKIFAINKELVRELSSVDNYFTCALLRVKGTRIDYVNASHPDVLYRKGDSAEARILKPKDATTFKLPPLGRSQLEQDAAPLSFAASSGDCFLVYTDCLVDGKNAKGEAYGMERLVNSFKRADTETSQTILSSIMIDYRSFIGRAKRQDDLTVVVMKKT